MATKPLEVLGIGSLEKHNFLVYFSDQTYATVSSSQLAQWFPKRIAIPESVTAVDHVGASLRSSLIPRDMEVRHNQTH